MTITIELADCMDGMKTLPDESMDMVITSPPYNLNISYGAYNDNLTREEYLNWIRAVFMEIDRVLTKEGHFFLNMGYSNLDPWISMDVANIAREGFVLQNLITWVKSIAIDDVTTGHFKPINSKRFLNPTNENIYHFTKTGDVDLDRLSIGVPYMWKCNIDNTGRVKSRLAKKLGFKNIKDYNNNATEERKEEFEELLAERLSNAKPRPTSRCRGNTWFIPYDTISNTSKDRGNHPATFPVQLAKNCMLLTGLKNGTVLEPFLGSGTTLIAAIQCGFDGIGYEIDEDYILYAKDRIHTEITNTLSPGKTLFESV